MTPERRAQIHQALVRFADGDRSAIDVLVRELWPVLLDFARRSLAHEQDAEDVAQNVFVRLCTRVGEFDRERDGLSWAFGIAAYEVMSQRRRRARRREVPGDALHAVPHEAALVEENLLRAELLQALELALGALTRQDRELLSGISPNNDARGATRRKRRQRALDRLRLTWRSLYGRP
ncbi:MAG TPA: sigma-70 family RNA polymerase sigma factor [Polyangiales bacterium]|nr:sigma-70 family RNA polymerase sigma factor [Polyangiales bacterium]